MATIMSSPQGEGALSQALSVGDLGLGLSGGQGYPGQVTARSAGEAGAHRGWPAGD